MKTDVLCVKKQLARPRRRFLVPSVLTRGVVQKVILAAHPSDNVAWMETAVVTEERAIVHMEHQHLRPEMIVICLPMNVVRELFIKMRVIMFPIYVAHQEEPFI